MDTPPKKPRRRTAGKSSPLGVTTGRNSKDPYLLAVAARIREARVRKGYAQEDFATHVPLDRSYYGSVERGGRNISLGTLARIALALGVETGELLPTLKEAKALLPSE